MDHPLVSVIMPAYNAEEYIAESIDSVVDQTYKNWELIIIDDGSTDNTKAIAKKRAEKDNRVQYLYQENGKQGKARNYGINKSKGEYIAFLDADDLWVKEKLEIQIQFLKKHPKIDLVFSKGYYLKDKKKTEFDIEIRNEWTKDDLPKFIEFNKIPILSVIVKRESLLEVSSFAESDQTQFGEDYLLWLMLLSKNNRFSSLSDRLFYYRVHVNQITINHQSETVDMLNLYRIFYLYYDDCLAHHAIFNKIKWGIFDSQYGKQHYQFANEIIGHYNKTLANGIKSFSFLQRIKLGQKILIKVFKVVEKIIFK